VFIGFIFIVNVVVFVRYLHSRTPLPEKPRYYLNINSDLMDNVEYEDKFKDITILTHLSEERIELLELLTKRWKGPISVTLSSRTLRFPNETILFLQKTSPDLLKKISFHLAYRELGEYPMNFARNFAWEGATTPLVLPIDADFIPSIDLADVIQTFSKSPIMNKVYQNKAVLVLAAFHLDCKIADSCTRGLPMLSDHPSQSTTNTTKWDKSKEIYQIHYAFLYEPYVIGSRLMPKFDTMFTLGNDKTSWTFELSAAKYEFYVLPKAYLGHIPHHKNIVWTLDQSDYDVYNAWVHFSRFFERIKVEYDGYDPICKGKKERQDVPRCLCWRWGCQEQSRLKKPTLFVKS
jgi:hypothetical protein